MAEEIVERLVAAGVDDWGLDNRSAMLRVPPEPLDGYGYDRARSPVLPMSLTAALAALAAFEADGELIGVLGTRFTAAYLACKRDEVERFSRYVTDRELREYAHHL
ncbi:hypothetical protein ACFFV7_00525 [Nonomuraea spiralis]|uniref:GS catalytic domain-containing protein n=1 Tax=Nonomuraea spiralis TaxID=46182 RepID=A0ABV5I545_9ACTN|nr:hypothetical protein [Nonomuraea spiralis]GGS62763.1 hypothetical protein GCM10010176_001040 [Nonomuraea spiralis]